MVSKVTTMKESDGFTSLMQKEASEAGIKISEQLHSNEKLMQSLASSLREFSPHAVMLVGRGSSDHAGVFAKYLIEIEIGLPTFAAAPSVATIYNRRLKLDSTLVIVISQSGRSPDILQQAQQAKNSGAFCIALLNDESAPLADIVDFVVPLKVGKEQSVAATKSYLATLSAILQLVAYWRQDLVLTDALKQIPDALTAAVNQAPQLIIEDLKGVNNLVVLGRGLGYAVSKEVALKLKEVLSIHAEAFSSAEFLHGPVTLVESQLKVLELQVDDESHSAHRKIIEEIKKRGAEPIHLHQNNNVHPRIAPLVLLQRFYLDIEKIAIARGLDPDNPCGLLKVTETL
ncbi:glucosamine-6-phosphate deaminase NagB-II [Aliikangiella sp. G2MR2-5]|uniref:glucosamine-6-phosphate deaminase NagB-II n=1 Tax=Aliikangiella sp. G2MR2-5 TaxID=2788943 RepID=UPI001AEE4C6A|nr:SIS domain-containing protein [Aliikangiella sp. G2MR2-5]